MSTSMRRGVPEKAAKWTGYRRVLWPTDFSPLAKAALPHAVGLAAGTGAELVLLHVLPSLAAYAVPDLSGALSVSLQQNARAAAQRQLHRLEKQGEGSELSNAHSPDRGGPIRPNPASRQAAPVRSDRPGHAWADRAGPCHYGQRGGECGPPCALPSADRASSEAAAGPVRGLRCSRGAPRPLLDGSRPAGAAPRGGVKLFFAPGGLEIEPDHRAHAGVITDRP